MQELARGRGALLHGNTPVRAIRPVGGEVDIVTDDGVTRVGSAAHGFKSASWFGRTLAGLACGDEAGPELEPFAFTRASPHQPIDRSAWMV